MSSLFDYIDAVAQSHVGVSRQDNQDFLGVVKDESKHAFFIADGMGGAKGGALASTQAVKTLSKLISAENNLDSTKIIEVVKTANLEVYKHALANPALKGMGTTLVGIIVTLSGCYLFNVGDSRVYRFRDRVLSLLTRDHTVLNELIEAGDDSVANQNFVDSISHILTRSVGTEEDVKVDCVPITVEDGDVFLICSDGLYNMVDPEKMLKTLRHNKPGKAVDELIKIANLNGGADNITVMVVKVNTGCQDLIEKSDKDSPWIQQVAPTPNLKEEDDISFTRDNDKSDDTNPSSVLDDEFLEREIVNGSSKRINLIKPLPMSLCILIGLFLAFIFVNFNNIVTYSNKMISGEEVSNKKRFKREIVESVEKVKSIKVLDSDELNNKDFKVEEKDLLLQQQKSIDDAKDINMIQDLKLELEETKRKNQLLEKKFMDLIYETEEIVSDKNEPVS